MRRVLRALLAWSALPRLAGSIKVRDMPAAPADRSHGAHPEWVDKVIGSMGTWEKTLQKCSDDAATPTLASVGHAASGALNGSALGPLDQYTDVPQALVDWIEAQRDVPRGAGRPGGPPPSLRQQGQPFALPDVPAPNGTAFPLTAAKCEQAFGGPDKSYTCRFSNLYAATGRLTAHFVKGQYIPDAQHMNIITEAGTKGHALSNDIHVHVHESEKAFQQYMVGLQVGLAQHRNLTGATLAFAPKWQFNIGHALYDGLYPAFVALLQWKEHRNPFRVFLQGWGVPSHVIAKVESMVPGAFQANAEVMGLIGGSGYLRDEWLPRPEYRHAIFETFVVGMGWNGQKLDMNSNFSIGGGRELEATRHYRDHVYKSVGIKAEVATRRFPRAVGLQGIIIDSKRWKKLSVDWIDSVIKTVAPYKVKLELIKWGKTDKVSKRATAHASTDTFAEQMRLMSRTDIHISSPGTAMMYQHFLRDGSVHINLGRHPYHPMRYMEEYMAEGAPYIRALYYWPPCNSSQYDVGEIVDLVLEAKQLILERPFGIPVPVGHNLSPVLQVAKAYMYATHNPAELAAKTPVHLLSPRLPVFRMVINNYFPHDLIGQCARRTNVNMCLWKALEQDFGAPFPGRAWCAPLLGDKDKTCMT